MALLELCGAGDGRPPYPGKSQPQIIVMVSTRNARPPIPADMPPLLRELISELWDRDVNRRPTLDVALTRLTAFFDAQQ